MLTLKKKIVLHGAESREAILRGVDLLADAVKVTLGPKGRNVVIGRRVRGEDPFVTKDGVTVASHVNPEDPREQIGADLLRSAAQKTVENAGDGTTTCVVLAQAMLHAGFETLKSGASPIAVKRGMDKACEAIVEAVRRMSIPVTDEMLYQVANISANGDAAIAEIVSEAIGAIGKDGVVTIEESRTLETYFELVSGLQLNSGYVSPYFMTNPDTMKCEYEDCRVLIWEGKLGSAKALVPLLNETAGKPLLIVSGDYENEAIAFLATNRVRKGLQVCAVRTGAYGDRRRELLRDLAAITGGRAITEDLGIKVENVISSDLGTSPKIIVDQNKTLIMGAWEKSEVTVRADEIRKQMETAAGVEKLHLEARLAGLTGGVAIIKVGAVTEVEMREKKDRVDDAMHAVKAAVEEGVVEGGGMALVRAREAVTWRDDGTSIVLDACVAPLRVICWNAGQAEMAMEVTTENGYNAASGEIENLVISGILDPTKVVIEALKNAVSVSGMILTTEAMIAEEIVDDGR